MNEHVAMSPATEPGIAAGPPRSSEEIRDWLDSRVSELAGVAPGSLDLDASLASYGLDSIVGLELVGDLAEWLGTTLSAELFWTYPTVNQLSRHLGTELARPPEEREVAPEFDACLVPLRTGGDAPPIFLVPGDGGGPEIIAARYARLGRALKNSPLVAFNIQAHLGSTLSSSDTSALAAEFSAAIEGRPQGGDFVLAGDCIGGLIAWEMARRLAACGQPPRVLVLMDAPMTSPLGLLTQRVHDALRNAQRHARALLAMARRALHHARQGAGRGSGYLRERARSAGDFWRQRQALAATHRGRAAHRRAVMRHRPEEYPGDVVLVVPKESEFPVSAQRWRELTRGDFQVCTVPGDHSSFLKEHVADTAQRLEALLADRAETATAPHSGGE